MPEQYLTFQRFHDPGLAQAVAGKLAIYDIPYELEDNRHFFDPSFANNQFNAEINLKLLPADFIRARKALEDYYRSLPDADPGYYLYDFTDRELIDIITKPDEWGAYDYQLAQKLLEERGLEINPALADLLKEQRTDALITPERVHRYWIYAGYIFSIAGGIIGAIIGWTLSYSRKTLPDGRRVYMYAEEDRDHGTRMQLLVAATLVIAVVVRFFITGRSAPVY